MENRRKFFPSGLWGNDTLQNRYERVKDALEAYHKGVLDDQDLVFIVKNAFVSKIYVSEAVAKAYPAPQPMFGNLAALYDQLLASHVLDLQDNPPVLHTDYMRILGLDSKVSYMKGRRIIAKTLPSIRVEHVVPANVYMPDVKNIKSFQDFKDIFDVVSICLVTDAEANLLNANGLRSGMPTGVNYKSNPFARYQTKGVKVY